MYLIANLGIFTLCDDVRFSSLATEQLLRPHDTGRTGGATTLPIIFIQEIFPDKQQIQRTLKKHWLTHVDAANCLPLVLTLQSIQILLTLGVLTGLIYMYSVDLIEPLFIQKSISA